MSHTKSRSSREAIPAGPLDVRDAFFTSLLLLGFDCEEMEGKYYTPFSKDMFALPNKKCFEVVMHFLFHKLNPAMAQDKFRYCWPIFDKKQEQNFRKVVYNWLSEVKKEEGDCFLPRIVPSLFLSPGGDKFYNLLLHFSRYVMHKTILGENGAKERELLLYPEVPAKKPHLVGLVGRGLQASCVRHRNSFLAQLQQDLILQEQWSAYAKELVSDYRRLTKQVRELEQQIRQEEALLMEQAQARGSPSLSKRRRSGALLEAEWDMMAIKRTQQVQKVRDMWTTVGKCLMNQRHERDVVESILEGAASRYRVDGSELNVQVPEMLLRECHKEIEKRNVGNTYQGGKLNLVSLIQLWNLSLRLYLEKLHQAPIADCDSIQPSVVTHVHTHHAHLTNLQALRSSMSREVLPSIKSSIKSLNQQLQVGRDVPTRDGSPRGARSHFLEQGLWLLPATPPVSFEPASVAQAGIDTPTRPISGALGKTSPTVDTPEAVSTLLHTVGRAVQQQGSLTQGTPTSALKLLRDQINRPSKLPKPVLHEASQKIDRRRIKSAPAKAGSSGTEETFLNVEDTLKQEETHRTETSHGSPSSSTSMRGPDHGMTQPRKAAKESRTAPSRKSKASLMRATPKQSARRVGGLHGASKSSKKQSTPSSTSHVGMSPLAKPVGVPTSSSVSRAHDMLIDQIADAVVGAANGSQEFKGLMDTPPSSSMGHGKSPIPHAVEDPLSELDQSAFITRDKLRHSPVSVSAQHTTHRTPTVTDSTKLNGESPVASKQTDRDAFITRDKLRHSPASVLTQYTAQRTPTRANSALGEESIIPSKQTDRDAFITKDKLHHSPVSLPSEHSSQRKPGSAGSRSRAGQSADTPVRDKMGSPPDADEQLLTGMESLVNGDNESPVGSLINLDASSPAQEEFYNGKQTDTHGVELRDLSFRLAEGLSLHQGTPPEGRHTPNINNSASLLDTGSPFYLDADSFNSSPLGNVGSEPSFDGTDGLVSNTPAKVTTPLGLIEMDQQLSEIFGTRTPQLPGRLRGRVSSASPTFISNRDSAGKGISPSVDRVKANLDLGSSPLSEELSDVLQGDMFSVGYESKESDEIKAKFPIRENVRKSGIMSSRKDSAPPKKHGSNGSQKSVTFSDHVDEHNISSRSVADGSFIGGEVFDDDGTATPLGMHSASESSHTLPTSFTNGSTTAPSPSLDGSKLPDTYVSPLPNGKVEGNVFSLDDPLEDDQDSLLESSVRIEDLLVHVSPAITPSATPNLRGSRMSSSRLSSASPGSMSRSASKPTYLLSPHLNDSSGLSLPADISGLSLDNEGLLSTHDASILKDRSNSQLITPDRKATPNLKSSQLLKPHSIQNSPKSALDFDILDEDESVLLPSSPYGQSPLAHPPTAALGQLIDF
ncbi:uncharacterized protein [Diadema setosum]|uniref:uncharacterized protein n=1 Tax=Diadema setosum TaxID=31175 RepID=UPI003B3AAEBF